MKYRGMSARGMRTAVAATALHRYGTLPVMELEDRIYDGFLGLFEAEAEFIPRLGQRDGHAARWGMSQAMIHMLGCATTAGETARWEMDSDLRLLGVATYFHDASTLIPERSWVTVSGEILPQSKIVERIMADDTATDRVVELTGAEDKSAVESWLNHVGNFISLEDTELEPAYTLEPPGRKPVADWLEPIVRVEGVMGGHTRAALVNEAASTGVTTWDSEEFDTHYDEDWPSREAADSRRPVNMLIADRDEVDPRLAAQLERTFCALSNWWHDRREFNLPQTVHPIFWGVLNGWEAEMVNGHEVTKVTNNDGDTVFVDGITFHAIISMVKLVGLAIEVIPGDFEEFSELRAVAAKVADHILELGVPNRDATVLGLCRKAFGVSDGPWYPMELPSAEVSRALAIEFIDGLDAFDSQKQSLLAFLDGATPSQAREIHDRLASRAKARSSR